MQTVFHQQLDSLTATIAVRCALAGRVAQGARHALLQPDGALAEDVISQYTKIAGTAASAERDALKLLDRHVPAVGDGRTVVAALINDADSGHGLAVHVSEIVHRRPAHTRHLRKLKVTSPKWAASLSISATRPKMLCNPAIHAKSVT